MTKKRTKIFTATGITIVVVGLLILIFIKGYFPVAVINTGFISRAYQIQARDLAKKLQPNLTNQALLDQLIKVKKEQQLVAGDNALLMSELKFDVTGKNEEYQKLLQTYFNSEEKLFAEFVVKPQLYDALLRIKYNSDLNLNASAYARAQDILKQIKSGASFDSLAKTESDDKITGQLGGDLGFVSSGQILPEVEQVLVQAKFGEVISNIVISRAGYNILYPVETAQKDGQTTWHMKYILVKTTGFEQWLSQELNKFFVWRIK
jgi:parvulin-like peptidyl-prolyl isomerase